MSEKKGRLKVVTEKDFVMGQPLFRPFRFSLLAGFVPVLYRHFPHHNLDLTGFTYMGQFKEPFVYFREHKRTTCGIVILHNN
jgi:hypothetical protein